MPERTRCKPTGPEHERLRYGLIEWTPDDGPVTRLRATPDDDPWYEKPRPERQGCVSSQEAEKRSNKLPRSPSAAGQTGANVPATNTGERIAQWPAVFHSLWITLWAPARRRAALPDVTSGFPWCWQPSQAWDAIGMHGCNPGRAASAIAGNPG